eukprot:s4801_g1.t1
MRCLRNWEPYSLSVELTRDFKTFNRAPVHQSCIELRLVLRTGHCQVSDGNAKPKLRYGLSTEGYATAAASAELSPAQVKEAKHLEALTGRMVSWRPRDLLRLLAMFPFARAGDAKFHAFWTQRLRDKTLGNGGRPQKSEVAGIRSRQAELWPPEPVREPSPKAKADDSQAPEPSAMQAQPSVADDKKAPSASKSDWKQEKKQWKEWKDWKESERREKEPKKDKEDKRKRDASWERKAEKKASRKSPKRRSRSRSRRSRSRRRRSRSRRKRNASREKRR